MPSFDVAHIREQGQNMLLFPVNDTFKNRPQSEQQATLRELELRAHNAGLAGGAAAIWNGGFLGPKNWHAFLRSINLSFVLANVNRKISW